MRFSIKKKMWLGFASLLILLFVTSSLVIIGLFDLTNRYKEILDVDMQKITHIKEMENSQRIIAATLLEFVSFKDPDLLNIIDTEIENATTSAENVLDIGTDEQTAKLFEDLKFNSEDYIATNNKLIQQVQKGRLNEATFVESKLLNEKLISILNELEQIHEEKIAQAQKSLNSYQTTAITIIIGITIFSIILGVIISTLISRLISKPITSVTHALEEVAKGNLLTESINIKNNDEIGKMGDTFNKMVSDIRSVVMSVRESSIQIAANAEQLSASTQETLASAQVVSTSAEQQMLTSNEQSSLMNSSVQAITELNDGVSQIASDNELMLRSTDGVQQLVKTGSSVVTDVANHMNTIHNTFNETTAIIKNVEKQSNEIQMITSLITDISDQTNLLALNAAIEAARAGDYGKGFAVVADEVRKLAEQSKNSATEITAMVQHIQKASSEAVRTISIGGDKVEQGLSKTNESLDVFNEIETSVGDVVVRVESVSAAIEQIQAMADNVKESVIQVQSLANNAVTLAESTSSATEEQLAANEEISTNASSLANLAEQLQTEVRHFKV